jgi:L-fucose mutarotase
MRMLKGIDPLISPELLWVLAQMGHGDEIVIADANFPAASVAARTVHGTALRMDCDAVRALRAILSLMPLDDFEPDPVMTMQVVGDAQAIPEVVAEAMPLLAAAQVKPAGLERFDFYRRAGGAFAILHCAELRIYGNFILRKGIIAG